MKFIITRLVLIGLCITLGACAGMSAIFDGPPVPYGQVTLNGKTVTVKKLGVDCVCPRIPATDSWVKGAVLPPRAGCNDGETICSPESIYVYNHEALEISTGLRHSDSPNPVTGCYEIRTAGGEYNKGDQLCVGAFGDYRIAGRTGGTTVAVAPATPDVAPAPVAASEAPVSSVVPATLASVAEPDAPVSVMAPEATVSAVAPAAPVSVAAPAAPAAVTAPAAQVPVAAPEVPTEQASLAGAGRLALRLSTNCGCATETSVARREVAAKNS